MKSRIKRLRLLSSRQVLTMLAVFFAAIVFGYLGESQYVQTSDLVTRNQMLKEMSEILVKLEPVLKDVDQINGKMLLDVDFPIEFKGIVSSGLVKNFPDGSWQLEDQLSRGEALNYFARLVDFLKSNLICNQLTLEGNFSFEDIPGGHWLEEPLKNLFGIGAVNNTNRLKLFPDDKMRMRELKAISSRIIEYFSSNMLILISEENGLSVMAKGALKELNLDSWQVSFDGQTWYEVPEDGKLPINKGSKKNLNLFFKHPLFLQAGPVEMPAIGASTAFIKLRRDYASFVSGQLENLACKSPVGDELELNRVKSRLAEIKRRKLSGIEQKLPSMDGQAANPLKNLKKIESEEMISLIPVETASPDSEYLSRDSLKETFKEKVMQSAVKEEIEKKQELEKMTHIEGSIIDSLTRKPIEGAMLVVDGLSNKVDSNGNFKIVAEKHRILEITAYCEGYSVLQMKHRVGYRSGNLRLPLKPELTVFSGKVTCYENHQPVAQALIRVGDKATRTNEDGTFAVRGIRPGYHQISCFSRNFLEAHEIVFVSTAQKEPFNFEIRQEFSSVQEDPTTDLAAWNPPIEEEVPSNF